MSPHMIMTHQNLDFNKHCQIPFGAYVQGNQDNNPTNDNSPRTVDAIYLRPLKNKQGGHEIMNLQTGKVITRNVVKEYPITDLVIKAVETMAEEQGIKTLKITGRNKIPLFPADWIAGVDYEGDQNENTENNDDEDDDYQQNDEYDIDLEEEAYDRIDQEEIDDLLAEPGQRNDDNNANPINENNENAANEADEAAGDGNEAAGDGNNTVTDEESTADESTSDRPTRNRTAPERLTYTHCQTEGKKVKFEDDDYHKLEMCHNLLTNVHPNPDEDVEYNPAIAMVIARVMSDINSGATAHGASLLNNTSTNVD